jgi:DNA-binding transcriptional ArsR family regulator
LFLTTLLRADFGEIAVLTVSFIIGVALYAGEGPLTAGALARRLRVPENAVSQTLAALTAAKLVSRTAAEPPRWVPTQPLDVASVKALLDAAREHGDGAGIEVPPGPADELERAIDRALDETLSGWTLRDLALGPDATEQPAPPRMADARPRPKWSADHT